MHSESPAPTLRTLALLGASAVLCGCVALPPSFEVAGTHAVVRSDDPADLVRVERMSAHLVPQVEALLGVKQERALEIWVQDEPAQFAFGVGSYADADGFYATGTGRIHLRRTSDRIDRTLAHELVHALLPQGWETMPGTLEEGVCDLVSQTLVQDSATRLRAGRLGAAAFATGGLLVEVQIDLPDDGGPTRTTLETRLRLESESAVSVDPQRVFSEDAGLSSSTMGPEEKKALYGLGYLIATRAEQRVGWEGVRSLCALQGQEAQAAWLAAADLSLEQPALRLAIGSEFGPRETWELLRAQPDFLIDQLATALLPWEHDLEAALTRTRVRIVYVGGDPAGIELHFVRALLPRIQAAQARL